MSSRRPSNGDHRLLPDPWSRKPRAASVRAHLRRVLDSRTFAGAPALARLLRHVVLHSLDGHTDELKEYALGVDVFDRGVGFDPREDTIVRVQARRLRSRLALYYRTEGRTEAVVIELRKGGYAPEFRRAETADVPQSGHVCWLACRERDYLLVDGEQIIGREPGSLVRLDSAKVSRRHARVVMRGGQVIIEDLGSKNGTFIDGTRIREATTMHPGDVIRVGTFSLVFHRSSGLSPTESETQC